jgi:hypothetical protein
MAGGLVYICAMPAFNCALGQSPVFYNPLVALAALLLLRAGSGRTRQPAARGQ